MAEDKNARVAAGITIGAAVTAALAYLHSKRAQTPEGDFVLPPEFIELIIAMASSAGAIELKLDEVVEELSKLSINVQGWPPNVKYTRTFSINCIALATAYRASEMPIPSGMSLVVKASPLNAIGSLIWVATSQAESLNPNSSYPLVPNEGIAYSVQNSTEFYVSTNVAGSIAIFSAERSM